MKIHPDEILASLKKGHPRRHRSLDMIHAICREIHDTPGNKDYSIKAVAMKGRDRGGPWFNSIISQKNGGHFRELIAAWATWDGCKVIPVRRQHGQTTDLTFSWVHILCPGTNGLSPLEPWRVMATRYIENLNEHGAKGFHERIFSLRTFLEHYLWPHKFFDPLKFLTLPKGTMPPPLVGDKETGPFLSRGVKRPNYIHDFINWTIEHDDRFSSYEDGVYVPLPGIRNPFPRLDSKGRIAYSESVRTVLPYKYIMILRTMLAPGENFDDWEWAQKAHGHSSATGSWFEVAPETIDKTDPDCVWRRREVPVRNYHQSTPNPRRHPNQPVGRRIITEMWSPVTAMALLLKLEIPLRTHQVRMLGSGETDVERVELTDRETHPLSGETTRIAAASWMALT
jgi:hypothetical protein